MVTLYAWATPNGLKPAILLEELGIPYAIRPVHIGAGEQFKDDFVRISPNSKIPALVDDRGDGDPIVVFESGAILIHLAETAGQFLPAGGQARVDTLAWLMFQMASVGPMFGQLFHFKSLETPVPYGVERYGKEVRRLYKVMDDQLASQPFLAGEYSIADMAVWPWAREPSFFGLKAEDYPNFKAYIERVGARPAVKRAAELDLKAPRG